MAATVRVAAPGPVGHQRLAHLTRKGESVLSTGLATHHEFTRPPVHVSQFEAPHLDGPQTQTRDKHHDGEVADTDVGSSVATVQQRLDIGGRHRRL